MSLNEVAFCFQSVNFLQCSVTYKDYIVSQIRQEHHLISRVFQQMQSEAIIHSDNDRTIKIPH